MKYNRFIGALQTTLADKIELSGTGVHSGASVSITLHPAEINTGLRFHILENNKVVSDIAADCQQVKNVTLCTVLGDDDGHIVATVEHLLSALRGLGVDNVIVTINSGEVPIMDGSSAVFVEAIDEIGVVEQDAPRRFIKVLKTVRIEEGDAYAELTPHDGFKLDVEIAYDNNVIGTQRIDLELTPENYRTELSRARTFGFMDEVQQLWAAGRALGASLDNTVALKDDKVVNPEGLRYTDEFVRHKTMDAVGDLALAGAPILGAFASHKGGHRMNYLVVQALLTDKSAWTYVDAPRIHENNESELAHIAMAN